MLSNTHCCLDAGGSCVAGPVEPGKGPSALFFTLRLHKDEHVCMRGLASTLTYMGLSIGIAAGAVLQLVPRETRTPSHKARQAARSGFHTSGGVSLLTDGPRTGCTAAGNLI